MLWARFERYTAWLTFGGCLVLVVGLCLDGIIHRLFPQTVLGENLFNLTNPGHLLIVVGVGLLVANSEFLLLNHAWRLKKEHLLKSACFFTAAVWLLGLCLLGLLLTMGSGGTGHSLSAIY